MSCNNCWHKATPGKSDGYCGSPDRTDLPNAYGTHHPLRKLPQDNGRDCKAYQVHPYYALGKVGVPNKPVRR